MSDILSVIDVDLRERANELVEYLVKQPPKRLAMRAASEFGWWCIAKGATTRSELQQAGHIGPEHKEQSDAENV